nr:MAG TPA: hypothetical protein [Bacteriophage sp.]
MQLIRRELEPKRSGRSVNRGRSPGSDDDRPKRQHAYQAQAATNQKRKVAIL